MTRTGNGDILVVDDEADFRRSLADVLEVMGYRVGQAEDGMAGIEKVTTSPYRMVVMDIRMPRKDGISALREMKGLRPEVPVMMVSAFRPDPDELPVVRKHAAGLYTKPLDMGRFLTALAGLCPPPNNPLP